MIIVVTKTPEFIGVIERWMVLAPCLRPFHVRELEVSGGLMTNGFDAQHLKASMDRIHHDWDEALSENGTQSLLKRYAEDATIESPLIEHLLRKKAGV